ncbi:hypothetical protein [Lactococcus lactis]|uniref:Phage protein n=1 Tax=Lactococcus lactis subsp. lactis TaxID=1360 RepID=A0A2N5W9N1_LACLL|nr:hypothetical protein [Lactococcus lactis]PLW58944.1 hypothetical protein CYU10_002334 [Lactococcus lactis subsp. lactis]
MEKIKILKAFTDIRTKQLYRVGQEVEVAEERVEEIEDNLETFGGGYFEVLDGKSKADETKPKNTAKKKG